LSRITGVKLEARLKELLDDTTIDESRIVIEAAVYADRSDHYRRS